MTDNVRRLDGLLPIEPFRRDGLGYIYEPEDIPVRLRVDYVKRHGDELRGEVKVTLRANNGHLHQANLNLSSTTARNTLAKHLDSVTRFSDGKPMLAWGPVVEAFCVGVMEAFRVGDPFVTIADIQPDEASAHLVQTVQPFGRPTLVYATGGTGKGWYSLRMAVSAATGISFGDHKVIRPVNVLILDWEERPQIIAGRLRMICNGMGIAVPRNIRYRRFRGPLAAQIHQVAAEMAANHEELVIVDSVEKACGAGGEGQGYQDRAGILFDALDLLGDVSILLIDHTAAPAAGRDPNQVTKAYGSTFKGNWAGLAFEMRVHQEQESSHSFVVLNAFKSNHGPKPKPIAFRYEWTDGAFNLKSWDANDLPDEAVPRTNEDRCYQVLLRGICSNNDLADEVGMSREQTRVTCQRSKRIMRMDRDTWTLVERHQKQTGDNMPTPIRGDAYEIEELPI